MSLGPKTLSPFLLAHYEKYKEQLISQTNYSDGIRGEGEYYGLARTGPYSFHDCYVAFRDNTKWCATVLSEKLCPWGERKRFLFQNHAVSICERIDKKIIDAAEAHYVAGIFNTPAAEAYILASSDSRSFKIRPPLFVPLFDKRNASHKKISKLAREAAYADDATMAKKLGLIEVEYLRLATAKPRG